MPQFGVPLEIIVVDDSLDINYNFNQVYSTGHSGYNCKLWS